jgi:hypothetical protein
MSHICDRAIEISLRVDVRFGPESEQDRVATQYVAMGHEQTRALQQHTVLRHFVGASEIGDSVVQLKRWRYRATR